MIFLASLLVLAPAPEPELDADFRCFALYLGTSVMAKASHKDEISDSAALASMYFLGRIRSRSRDVSLVEGIQRAASGVSENVARAETERCQGVMRGVKADLEVVLKKS